MISWASAYLNTIYLCVYFGRCFVCSWRIMKPWLITKKSDQRLTKTCSRQEGQAYNLPENSVIPVGNEDLEHLCSHSEQRYLILWTDKLNRFNIWMKALCLKIRYETRWIDCKLLVPFLIHLLHYIRFPFCLFVFVVVIFLTVLILKCQIAKPNFHQFKTVFC